MTELMTSAMLLLSIFYGPATAAAKTADTVAAKIYANDPAIVDGVALAAPVGTNTNIEPDVREYFKDIPILAEIAKCESDFRHINANGEIIEGAVNKDDIGVMQINKFYHEEEASKLGLDLKTLRGNMEFARKLYAKYGTSPWQSSSVCWKKFVSIAKK